MYNKIQDIKDKIRDILKARNMSIYQLALKSEVSEACIRNWFSKRNYVPSLESLFKVGEALGLSLSQFLLDKDETMYPVDASTKNLIENWSKLDNEKRDIVLKIIKTFNRE